MGLDLTLFSISNKAKFVLEKAKLNQNYANDFDKIQDMDSLKLNLRMVQSIDKAQENILKELIEDSKIVLSDYSDNKIEKYRFYSKTRGYETLSYLLREFLKDKHCNIINEKIFYGGTDINNTESICLKYFDSHEVIQIHDLLKSIDFSDIVKFYDYPKMESTVYKPTRPENLHYLESEFEELKTFFDEATRLNSFIITKIS